MPAKTAVTVAALGLALAAPAYLAATAFAAPAFGQKPSPTAGVDADRMRDVARKPAEALAFIGVKPGDKVLELLPGRGYFTRLFSVVVGPAGHVYAMAPPVNPETGKPADPDPLAAETGYGNVTGAAMMLGAPISSPEPVDVIFTAQNYHDLHLSRAGLDVVALDRQLFKALKPGGVFIVEDHAAVDGSGLTPDAKGATTPDRLHRIDEAVVKAQALAAGFVLDGESDLLRNPADPRTVIVFDPSIRGHTDQFLLRFRKPG